MGKFFRPPPLEKILDAPLAMSYELGRARFGSRAGPEWARPGWDGLSRTGLELIRAGLEWDEVGLVVC